MKKAAGILEAVDRRTKLAGENRMELLMFRLPDQEQVYGINVFKVREVMHCPNLTSLPGGHPDVKGVMDFRGEPIPVIDIKLAIWNKETEVQQGKFVIIAEHNMTTQGLLVSSVDRIVNLNWDEILTPPVGAQASSGSYLTAVTEVDDRLVEIIDVERIIEEIQPCSKEVSSDIKKEIKQESDEEKEKVIVVADDSSVARKQIENCISQIGINILAFNDGKQALDYLKDLSAAGTKATDEIMMVISDVEMPVMDGYTLTTQIRADENLKDLYVILHTSLSGVFNEALVEKVGANNFIAKFQPDVLAEEVKIAIEHMNT